MTVGTIERIRSAGYFCVTWSLTEEPVMSVIEQAAVRVQRPRRQAAASRPAPHEQLGVALEEEHGLVTDELEGRPTADLAGLGERELLTIAGARPGGRRSAAARELLVSRYGNLVRSCVRQYSRSLEPAEDLMQVGYVGLLKAIGNFDPDGAGGLASFARPYISGEIKRHFRDKRWPVRVPRPVQELVLVIRAEAGQLTQELGRDPTESDFARHLGVSSDTLREARRAELAFQPGSLDAPLGAGPGAPTLADLIGAEDPQLEHMLSMRAVAAHWGELPPRERQILIMRYYDDMTQAQIGQQLGISQMHVSRLTTRALGHLRTRLLSRQDQAGRVLVAETGP
jgi:RNA polymerase sigma-B factor